MQQPQLLLQPHGKLEDVVSTHAALTDTQNTLSVYYLSTLHVLGHPMHMQKLSHTQQFAWPQMFKLKADSWPLPVSAHHVLLHSLLAQHMACQEMRAQDNLRWLSCLLMLSYQPVYAAGRQLGQLSVLCGLAVAGRVASTMAAAAATGGGGTFCQLQSCPALCIISIHACMPMMGIQQQLHHCNMAVLGCFMKSWAALLVCSIHRCACEQLQKLFCCCCVTIFCCAVQHAIRLRFRHKRSRYRHPKGSVQQPGRLADAETSTTSFAEQVI